jgi:hypothetical protein
MSDAPAPLQTGLMTYAGAPAEGAAPSRLIVCCHCGNDDARLLERIAHGWLCLVCSKVFPWH